MTILNLTVVQVHRMPLASARLLCPPGFKEKQHLQATCLKITGISHSFFRASLCNPMVLNSVSFCGNRITRIVQRYSRRTRHQTGNVIGSLQGQGMSATSEGTQEHQIWRDITERYDTAQGKHASSFTETTTEIFEDGGFPYILKIACTLRDKPKAPKEKGAWKNPFLPPDEDLYVCKLSDTHSLVLNKFNITSHHVIIITNEFVSQEDPLTAADFAATRKVVTSMPGEGGMAFFNCGSISGASQPHKHIQCIPLPIAYSSDSTPLSPPFGGVIQNALTVSEAQAFKDVIHVDRLPFVHGIVKVDIDKDSTLFVDGYNAIMENLEQNSDSLWTRNDSYNLIMTKKYMMIVPRNKESIGSVGCNAMGFAGSFFLATQQEIDDVKRYGPTQVLSELGFSRV